MSKLNKVKNEFIHLRSSGLSYDKISLEIGVSKPTLIKWGQEFKEEIIKLEDVEFSLFKEEFIRGRKHRIIKKAELIHRLEEELAKRNFLNIPDEKLIKLIDEQNAFFNKELDLNNDNDFDFTKKLIKDLDSLKFDLF